MFRQKKKNEQGSVLIIVLGILLVAAVVAVGLLRLTDAQTRIIHCLTGDDSSLYTAEKVSNQYLWEFNEDQSFAFLGDAAKYQRTVNADHTVTYRPLSYESGAAYRTEIVVPQEQDESGIWKESTKKALVRVTSWQPVPGDPGDHSRAKTIEVEMAKRTFTQYGWITDSERDEENQPVYWRENDEFYGPLHTNGSLYLYYTWLGTPPAFFGKTSYSESLEVAPALVGHTPEETAADPNIFHKGVTKVDKIGWPVSNTYLISLAESSGGHYYHGRTCIMLEGSRYVVRSYDSQTDHWYYNGMTYEYEPPNPDINNDIYNERGVYYYPQKDGYVWKYPTTSGTATFQNFRLYAASVGAAPMNIPLPANGVIYVDGNECSENNYTSDTSKFDRALGNVFVSGTLNGQLTIGAKNDIFITTYDPTDWRNPWIRPGTIPQMRNSFQGFTATNGLEYGSTSFIHVYDADGNWDHEEVTPENASDILGLAAQQNIRILHRSWPAPIEEKQNTLYHARNWGWFDIYGIDHPPLPDAHVVNDATGDHLNINIQAAMFCNTGSFGFEDPRRGLARSTMYVVGSVAEKLVHCPGDFDWTATINIDGYKRNITHDPRMTYLSPPHFIEPTQAGFQTVHWRESHTPVTEP